MRILVVSDTHGDIRNLEEVIRKHRDAQVIFHCGDGANEAEQMKSIFPDRAFICVKGNCDLCCDYPNIETITLEGKKFFITHGHIYNVKSTLLNLSLAIGEAQAQVAVFGHTHNPLCLYEDGVYFLNPGSLRGYKGSYALVDVSEKGILINHQSV